MTVAIVLLVYAVGAGLTFGYLDDFDGETGTRVSLAWQWPITWAVIAGHRLAKRRRRLRELPAPRCRCVGGSEPCPRPPDDGAYR